MDPNAEPIRATIEAVSENCRWEHDRQRFFVGEVERCGHRAGAQPLIFHGGRYFTELPL